MIFDERQIGDLSNIATRFDLALIILFGSSVSERLHVKSDIDIAVYLSKEKPNLKEYSELVEAFHEVFSCKENEIDLSFINHADPLFLKKILEKCQLLYGSSSKFRQLKIYAFKRYQDHKRYFKMEEEFAKRFIEGSLSKR
jgi:predicted nucleotidyltransferase